MTERVKIDQDWADNFKVKVVANGRLMPITMLTFVIAVATMSVGNEIAKSNDLRRQELEVAKKTISVGFFAILCAFFKSADKEKVIILCQRQCMKSSKSKTVNGLPGQFVTVIMGFLMCQTLIKL